MSAIDLLKRQEVREKRRSVALLLKQPRVSQLRELFERNSRSRVDQALPPRRTHHAFSEDLKALEHIGEGNVEGVEDALAALEGSGGQDATIDISNRQRTNSTLSSVSTSTDSTDSSHDADVANLSEPELDGMIAFSPFASRS